jgi:site-specific recombinase XerD
MGLRRRRSTDCRRHRVLHIEGNNQPACRSSPRTARTLDLAIGERTEGPILLRHDGRRLDARTAYRWVRAVGKRAGLDRTHPHTLRAAYIMAALDAGVPLRDVPKSPPPRRPANHHHLRPATT